ncbi:prolipoprotein diacylglyceryl transferase [Parasediminibacterium sp. JCM 36343]|uniref:prolipoprotein diacylglyceryl transferase n=1 Tax=Parasediminibacterium sp. JCM 36343 TaxID=3374279 RepID=UPI00397A9D03
MYPNLYYAFKDLFGLQWPFLKLVNSFGFFVAICFLTAAWLVNLELKRKQQQGFLTYTEEKIMVGAPASIADLLVNFLLGFVFGYKIIAAFVMPTVLNDPQSFILSSQGNWPIGLLVGGLFASLKWWEKNKEKLANPEQRVIRIWPNDRVGDMVIYAAVFGFAGAKIFHNLENWGDFIKNPIDALISFSGLTFYGGLICAGAAIIFFAKKHKIIIIHLADAFCPALMLGYAIGRIGCQVSGDGDWGILNSSYISAPTGQLIEANPYDFQKALAHNSDFYTSQFKTLDAVHHISVQPFWHLPNWLFAYNYPHNVISEGVRVAGCDAQQYCSQLPIAVFPTALYEIIMCTTLFFILWSLRKKIKTPGVITGIYLILNGTERFFIEKIRVNTKYESLPFQPTQAELISFLLIIAGIFLLVKVSNKKTVKTVPSTAS